VEFRLRFGYRQFLFILRGKIGLEFNMFTDDFYPRMPFSFTVAPAVLFEG
jgi:hypothetical protein